MSVSAILVRIAAILLLIGALSNLVLDITGLMRSDAPLSLAVADGIANTLPLLGIAALLWGVGSVLTRVENPAQSIHSLTALEQRVEDVYARVEGLHKETHRLAESVARVAPADTQQANPSSELAMLMARLEEIRDLVQLDESTRQNYARTQSLPRKQPLVTEAARLIRIRHFPAAADTLKTLQSQFPNDSDVARLTQEHAAATAAIEAEAFGRLRTLTTDQIAVGAWEDAHENVTRYVSQYPNSVPGRELLLSLQRERSISDEETAEALFEEIREAVDFRQWRRAFVSAQSFLERFATHRKADAIKMQLPTLQGNAEIEERQETETHIQELIRAKDFTQAIALAEDLLDRYPMSPQAGSLEQMLPKMREMAAERQAVSK